MENMCLVDWLGGFGKFWLAALPVLALCLIFRVMRNSHNMLLSRMGEELLEARKRGGLGVNSGEVWDGYPRPRMRRESFISLNGTWKLNGREILVPFPPQSLLSGYQGRVGARLEYSREFAVTKQGDSRILLHFGAVDQVAEVYVNGHCAGRHEGGYLPFEFDVTEYVREGDNTLLVRVRDTLSHRYPYGKQRKNRGGMWYTPVSGIWQSVWLEYVPAVYIRKLDVAADTGKVTVDVESSSGGGPVTVSIALHDGSVHTVCGEGTRVEIDLTKLRAADGTGYQPLLWTMEHPYLYEMTVTLGQDKVSSYFGLRTVSLEKKGGLSRVCLNGKPIFLHGVLDQGYYCDGIFLPAGEGEYEQDILRMKELGVNLLRKHIKIEPECFYYYCDLHGMLVMQDMVNSGGYSWIRDTALPTIGIYPKEGGGLWGGKRRREFFVRHMEDTIRNLRGHPCVIAYTIFNEGWGQFDGNTMYERAVRLDPTRLYDTASGWFPVEKSDFDSRHVYFRLLNLSVKSDKPVLVSECGGYSCCVPGHFYAKFNRYGYGNCANEEELTERIRALYEESVLPGIAKGICGCVYTQLSDVEDETNGFYTYDRRVCKVDKGVMQDIAGRLAEAVSEA